jgi:hypothetical protein
MVKGNNTSTDWTTTKGLDDLTTIHGREKQKGSVGYTNLTDRSVFLANSNAMSI